MTDKMFDEKGLRARNENDPEKMAARDENADVEGHLRSAREPEEASEAGRMAAKDEDDAADVEGHRLASFEPEKTREPGRMAARDEDEDGGEEGLRVR